LAGFAGFCKPGSNSAWSCRILPIATGLIAIPALAAANTPIGELWVLGAPVFLTYHGLVWLLAAITVIEGLALSLILNISLMRSLGIALLVNLFSSVLGAILYFTKACFLIWCLLLIPLSRPVEDRLGLPTIPLLVPGVFFVVFLGSAFWILLASDLFGSLDVRTRLLALIPAFGISLMAEVIFHLFLDRQRSPLRILIAWTIGNTCSYALLGAVFLFNPVPDYLSPGANPWTVAGDIRNALDRGNVERALEHSETLRAIGRRAPDYFLFRPEPVMQLAQTLEEQGRHRQALSVLSILPDADGSRLRPDVKPHRDRILEELRSSHRDAPPHP